MKKVLFAAVAVCGFVAANAQLIDVNGDTRLKDDRSTIGIKLALDNVIVMTPNRTEGTALFNSVNDYKDGQHVSEDGWLFPATEGYFGFEVSSNRNFNVTITPASQYFTGSGGTGASAASNNMPISILKWKLVSNGTGGSAAGTAASTFNPLTWGTSSGVSAPVINSGQRGYEKKFSLDFKAEPGFNYNGGNYNADVYVTATQQ